MARDFTDAGLKRKANKIAADFLKATKWEPGATDFPQEDDRTELRVIWADLIDRLENGVKTRATSTEAK